MLREIIRPFTARGNLAEELQPRALLVAVVPDLGPVGNQVRLAQYRRKKAMKAINPDLTFPIEIYE